MNIAKRLSTVVREARLEDRPQQNDMAEAVQQTLEKGGFLMAEAGTGVSKYPRDWPLGPVPSPTICPKSLMARTLVSVQPE